MATATETAEETTYEYAATVETTAPATRRVTIEIPQDRIKSKLQEQLNDVRQTIAIPGFRVGRAPVAVVEKRFGKDIKDQVRMDLVRESLTQVVEKNSLNILGEPEFDQDQDLSLPDAGDLKFSFLVEIRPEFTLPAFENVTVRKPKIDIKDEHVNQALTNLRNQQGQLVPVEDRGTQEGDYVNADIVVRKGEEVVAEQLGADIVVRDGVIASIQVKDFAKLLDGAKLDETKTFSVEVNKDHPSPDLAGQTVQFSVKINDIKVLEPAEVDQDFLDQFGFENHEALMKELRNQMEQRVDADVRTAMHNQLRVLLSKSVEMELPPKTLDKQKTIVARRNLTQLIQQGVVQGDQIEPAFKKLLESAGEQAAAELKLYFILTKLAEDANVDVTEQDINSAVAQLAVQQGKRPEKLKSEMAQDGSLDHLALSIRDGKALDDVLQKTKIEEVENTEGKVLEATVG